jgi:Spy/CpxP family protein refolding chaperone
MRNRTIALLALVSVIVLGSVAVAAARGWGPLGAWQGKSLTARAQELGLTDAQVAQIERVQTKYRQELDALHTTLTTKMKELRDASSQSNQSARDAAKAAMAEIQKQISDLTQKMRDELSKVLTKDQLAKIGSSIGLAMPRGFGPPFMGRPAMPAPDASKISENAKSLGARLAEQLNLTDQQLAALQKLQAGYFAQVAPLNTQLVQKNNELRLMQWQKNPDAAAVTAKLQEIKAIQQQIQELEKKLKEQMNAVLTQEQLAAIGQKAGFGGPGLGFPGPGIRCGPGMGPKRGIR